MVGSWYRPTIEQGTLPGRLEMGSAHTEATETLPQWSGTMANSAAPSSSGGLVHLLMRNEAGSSEARPVKAGAMIDMETCKFLLCRVPLTYILQKQN